MDGNRRFARKIHLAASSGHVAGFSKLTDVLRWCNDLGVRHVSVYAFAINNFNRSPEEVSTLMSLARNKLRELADKSDLVQKHGLRIRVVGYRELLSADVRESIEHAEETTKDNKGMTLNVCFPYSATDEISSAIRTVVEDVGSGKLQAAEADEKALEERLQIPGPDLDILIRTSGQIRFSNFMLWQSSKMAYIQFVDAYWPEFSLRHMLYILVSWQLSSKRIESRKRKSAKRQIDSKAAASAESATASDNDTCCS
ncbi:Di-trans-poly-cis-decaprenylcistransferase [Martensiomyces pterosporus]|nr:Di-trans-poly-cis-decaprenylcistransferase [Martensiomyces pterosporus]